MIHQYENNGYRIVLDVNSGSVHVVDEVVYGLIPIVESALAENMTDVSELTERAIEQSSYEESECREAVSEILELKEAGMLFTEDIYEAYIDRKSVV